MNKKALDLFCGGGGSSMGLKNNGFDVTGIDINEQPEYPFKFIKQDVFNLSIDFLKQFDFIWASPTCQIHS
jgi:DNA (cytosine-5)-methyltransferase 1